MRRFIVAKQKALARERIEKLFEVAEREFRKFPKRSDRYVEMARKIAMKFNVRMPPRLKRRFCKHCYRYLQPGVNCRVRTKNKKVIYCCLSCEKYMRFPFLKEKSSRK